VYAARSLALGPSPRVPSGADYSLNVFPDGSTSAGSDEGPNPAGEIEPATDSSGNAVAASLWASTLRSASLLRSAALFDFSRTGEEETSALVSFPGLLETAARRGRHVPVGGLPLWRALWSVPGGAAADSAAGRSDAPDAEEAAEAAAVLANAVYATFVAGAAIASGDGPSRGWTSEGVGVGSGGGSPSAPSALQLEEASIALRAAYSADFASARAALFPDMAVPSLDAYEAGQWESRAVSDDLGDLASVLAATNFLFAVLAVVVMFLCFFSLLASVATNIREQQREIGVLRAVGLSPSRLARVYSHEATLLVAAAALLGTGVGTASAWAFAQQRSLFTGLPLALVFPWTIVIAVVIASFVCGLLASCAPARAAGSERITKLTAGGT